MDFVTGLPCTCGQSMIIVIFDWMSKYYHLGSLSVAHIAKCVAISSFSKLFVYKASPRSSHMTVQKVFLSKF